MTVDPASPEKDIVHSQPEVEKEVQSELAIETPKEPAVEKKINSEAARLRIHKREWKEKLEKIDSAGVTDDDRKAAMEIAKSKGFDVSKEENKGTVDLVLDVAAKQNEIRNGLKKKELADASRANLTETLKELGYEVGSREYNVAGNTLFKEIGISDPDVFHPDNKEYIEKQISELASKLIPKKKTKDEVEITITNKAGAPKPAAESRSAASSVTQASEAKAISQKFRVSEARATEIKELQSKLPKRLQPR